jgi:hypothetical protein
MATEPTPGPWERNGNESSMLVIGYDPRLYPEQERCTVARVDPAGDRLPVEVGDANLRLIVAAPELLSLLKYLVVESYEHEKGHRGQAGPCSCAAHRVQARKLIEHIEGRD